MKMLELEGRWLCYYGGIIWAVAYFYPNPEVLIFGALVILLGAMTYNNNVNYKLLFPLLYPLAPMLFIFALAQSFGIKYLVWLVFIVGMTDTAAYYIGKSIGVTPFSPVSPKKTWEGFYAGVSAGTILGILFGTFFIAPITPFAALVISFFVSMASVFGDLFESYLKRKAGVKDSGDILPGHGGMLDRVDGYLFGAITMVILLRAFVN
jgi:phosphatidate cytidylyltransferase